VGNLEVLDLSEPEEDHSLDLEEPVNLFHQDLPLVRWDLVELVVCSLVDSLEVSFQELLVVSLADNSQEQLVVSLELQLQLADDLVVLGLQQALMLLV
jgi:hypothetical protein